MRKYQKIVDELIRESFPELREEKIKIVGFPNVLRTWSFAQRGFKNYYIFINKSRRGAKLVALKGEFAHELCHVVLDHMSKSFFGDLFHNFFKKFPSFLFNTNFSRKIETKVDRETIRRGYGHELVALTKEWNKFFGENFVKKYLFSRGYLSEGEIKSYAVKIGKW